MTEPIKFPVSAADDVPDADEHRDDATVRPDAPSNAVYARVGDVVLYAARNGIRRGLRPEDIIREIRAEYHVHLNVGELRLLLASRDRGGPTK